MTRETVRDFTMTPIFKSINLKITIDITSYQAECTSTHKPLPTLSDL